MTYPLPGESALALLKEFEQGPDGGFAAKPYRCPAGYLTIGWGHRIRTSDQFQPPISLAEAESLLRKDLRNYAITPGLLGANIPLTQSMIDALACFMFNVGVGAFLGSTLREKLIQGDYAGAGDEFKRWNKAAGKALAGLNRRREAERALFLRDGLPH